MTVKCPIARMKCPESGEECPCWSEIVQESAQTGEVRVLKDCIFRLMPVLLIEVIKASNRPAAAVESVRNEMFRGLAMVANSVQEVQKLPGKNNGG